MKITGPQWLKRYKLYKLLFVCITIVTIWILLGEMIYDRIILSILSHIAVYIETPKVSLYPFNVYHYNINYLTQPKCNSNYDVVFLVKTSINNHNRRLAIRETWGREDRFNIRTIFIAGAFKQNFINQIKKENDNYEDILLADFYDNYDNLSLKCIVALNWAKQYCSTSKFYVLADDDSYISTKNLFIYLFKTHLYDQISLHSNMFINSSILHAKISLQKKFIGGELMKSRPVLRIGKYGVSKYDYPTVRYPDYIDGHIVIMSRDVIYDITDAAYHVKYFRLDDVYMSHLAMKAGLQLKNIPRITREYIHFWDVFLFRTITIRNYDNIISSHYIKSPQQLIKIWTMQSKRGNV